MKQLDIFGAEHDLAELGHARALDPESSHTTVRSIVKDKTLAADILRAVVRIYRENHGASMTDDDVLDELIATYPGVRFQRNVIARSRGLLEPLYIQRGPMVKGVTGRPTISYWPTLTALQWVDA
jgi:hypothetical protein